MTVSSLSHVGPSDGDPLTPGELDILLAIPRAAQSSPDSLLFRLPKGDHPSEGYVDLTCLQTCSLVSRLATSWRTRLSALLDYDVGPGTTVCVVANPHVHGVFHQQALRALGCTLQFVSHLYGNDVIDDQLKRSGCDVVIHCGKGAAWAREREKLGIHTIELSESEYSHAVAQREVSISEPAPEWPTPKRPSPALIVQSSGTTGVPKLSTFSLHFSTYSVAWNCKRYLAHKFTKSNKTPRTHPRLICTAPFASSHHRALICNLVTATPICLIPSSDCASLSGQELAAWMEALDVGSLLSSPHKLRSLLLLNEHTELLQSLYSIVVLSDVVDEELSALITQKELKVTNEHGVMELGGLLAATSPPYTHLFPYPDFPPPIAIPLLEKRSEGEPSQQSRPPGRVVQLWYLVDLLPQLAHAVAYGGIPLKLKPFPGPGPAHGKLSMCLEDVFYETSLPGNETNDQDRQVAYISLGRMDDYLRLSTNRQEFSAFQYETRVRPLIRSELVGSQWQLDSIQLFGADLPKTALVIQLQGEGEPDEPTMHALRRAVGEANSRLGHLEHARVEPLKRMLVVTLSANELDPPSEPASVARSAFAHLRLLHTSKHTLRRGHNAKIFAPWLKQLDWS